MDLGIALCKALEHRRQNVAGLSVSGGDRQGPGIFGLEFGADTFEIVELLQGPPRGRHHYFSPRRQRCQAFALADEDRHPQFIFQLPNLLADAGLRGEKRFGRDGYIQPMVDDGAQIAQLLQVHEGPYNQSVKIRLDYIARPQFDFPLERHMAQFFAIHPVNPQSRLIRQAAAIVRSGGVIAYPTDSSYAFGCPLGDVAAAQRIRQLRGVDDKHHLTLVCRDLAEIGRYASLDNWQFRIVKEGIPGSYTFLLPAAREVPRRLKHPRRRTIGVRVPEHAVVRALLADLDEPLLSSTLIPAGATEPLNDPQEIRARYEHAVELIIDSGPCHLQPTTVVDLAVSPPALIRVGRGDPARLGLAVSA